MTGRLATWLPVALISITIGAVGQLLLKLASKSGLTLSGPGAIHSLLRLVVNPYMILGVVCFLLSMVLWVKVQTMTPLSSSYPLVSLGYIIVALLSFLILGERLAVKQILAIGVIVFGVFLLGQR